MNIEVHREGEEEEEGLDGDEEEEDDLLMAAMAAGVSSFGQLQLAPTAEVVVGVDPDANGAVAILRRQAAGIHAEVVDAPTVKVSVGKTMRRRHDATSIAAIVRNIGAPEGSVAFVEAGGFMPSNGKQGYYSTGYGQGVWVGVLCAHGFQVIPTPAASWKRAMGLRGKQFTKDDSRTLAGRLFPSLVSQLKRKKDHGRAEALLIAAFGRGLHCNGLPQLQLREELRIEELQLEYSV